MASESSQSSSPSPSPSSLPSPSPGDTFVGSFISLVSKSEIRYEGILYHLNVHDSTLGLKNVRSCGTEGRKKDGPQVPPSDAVYDYILFRGSDIKDLQVNPSPSVQSRKDIQSEKDINQSSQSRPAVSSPPTGYDRGYGLGRGGQWVHSPALTSKPAPTTLHSPAPLGDGGSLKESPASMPMPMPMPSFVQGNKLASTGVPLGMMQHAVSSSSTKHNDQAQIVDMFASPIMGLVDDTTKVVTHTPDVASNLSYSSNPSPLGQAQHRTPPGLASSPSNLAPLSEASLSAPYIQNTHPTAPQAIGKGVYDSQINHRNRSTPYTLPAVTSDSAPVIPDPLSSSPQSFFGMELLQSNTASVGVPSRSLATTHQAPLLPLPVSAHQSWIPSSSAEFSEEFDFEAMNDKFNKSELWGFLGKNNQTNHTEKTAVEPSEEGKTKPAYKKDDFFDTISCNRLDRTARSGQQQQQIQFPEHMRQDPQGFGNHFQRPLQPQPGQGAYLAAQTNYHGGYNNNNNDYSNSGYGYYSGGGRGRGRNTHF
ncbi:decapping 5-like protein isoform X1 [Brassica rapa]|uniref:DFDF domain-containing protein n=1 Tax=Brassica campestris TaxID=3711 RepID=M4DZL7_BRACM|nr:decapping 5-like protein isoform X1 [Brassica rapa]